MIEIDPDQHVVEELLDWANRRGIGLLVGPPEGILRGNLIRYNVYGRRVSFCSDMDEVRYGDDLRKWVSEESKHGWPRRAHRPITDAMIANLDLPESIKRELSDRHRETA